MTDPADRHHTPDLPAGVHTTGEPHDTTPAAAAGSLAPPDADASVDRVGGAPTELEPAGAASNESSAAIDALRRRMNLLVGGMAVLLVGAFVVIGLLFGRVADAESDAEAARSDLAAVADGGGASTAELEQLRTDLERVEAGAALYASQIEGFQEQLVELEPEITAGIDEAITGLREFSESTIEFNVPIDEVIPIDTEVVIDRTVEVPIDTDLPISQDIQTTVEVDTPVGKIPLDISVPVDVVVPIDLVLEVPINETVPIQDEFPVQLDVPIAIDVAETELVTLTDSLVTVLESLQDIVTGLGG